MANATRKKPLRKERREEMLEDHSDLRNMQEAHEVVYGPRPTVTRIFKLRQKEGWE